MTTNEVDVHFASGRDLLSAYWGHLTGGGLAVAPAQASAPLTEGRTITLRVHVAAQSQVSIRGTVVKSSSSKAVVAFANSDAKERLLTAAFSARIMDTEARVATTDSEQPAEIEVRVHRLSETGCCLRVDSDAKAEVLSLGTDLSVEIGDARVTGCVVASTGAERWILFDVECNPEQALRAALCTAAQGDSMESLAIV